MNDSGQSLKQERSNFFFHLTAKLSASQMLSSLTAAFIALCQWLLTSVMIVMFLVFIQGIQLVNWHLLLDGLQWDALPWLRTITWFKFDPQCANFFPTIWLLPAMVVVLGMLFGKKMWPALAIGVFLSSNGWLNHYIHYCPPLSDVSHSPVSQQSYLSIIKSLIDFSVFFPENDFLADLYGNSNQEREFFLNAINNRLILFLMVFCGALFLQSLGIGKQLKGLILVSARDQSRESMYWSLLKLPFILAVYGLITMVAAWWLAIIPANQWLVWFMRWVISCWIASLLLMSAYLAWRLTFPFKNANLNKEKQQNDANKAHSEWCKSGLSWRFWAPYVMLGGLSGIGMWFGHYFLHLNQIIALERQTEHFSSLLQQRLRHLEVVAYSVSAWFKGNRNRENAVEALAYLDRITQPDGFDLIEAVAVQPQFQSVRFEADRYSGRGLGYTEIAVRSLWNHLSYAQAQLTNFDRRDIRWQLKKASESGMSLLFYDAINQLSSASDKYGNALVRYIVPMFSEPTAEEFTAPSEHLVELDNHLPNTEFRAGQLINKGFDTFSSNFLPIAENFLVFSISLERLMGEFFPEEHRLLNPQVVIQQKSKGKIIYGGQDVIQSPRFEAFNVELLGQEWLVSVSRPLAYGQASYRNIIVLNSTIWGVIFALCLSILLAEKLKAVYFQSIRFKKHSVLNRSVQSSLMKVNAESDARHSNVPKIRHWSGEIERPLQSFLRQSAKVLQEDKAINESLERSKMSDLELRGQYLKKSKSDLLALHLVAWQLMLKIRALKQKPQQDQ